MQRIRIAVVLSLLAAFVAVGCSGGSDQPVPTKDEFKKTAPPAQWRGPGQPGGPASGPVSGGPPAGAPPAGGTAPTGSGAQ